MLRQKATDSDDNSDPEEGIEAVAPDEQAFIFNSTIPLQLPPLASRLSPYVKTMAQGKEWWTQWVTIGIAALLTYSYGATTNIQIAIMTVITLEGAASEVHLIPASIGAFVGGHNALLEPNALSYFWVVFLSCVVGFVWSFFITKYKILDGYAGRLGSTTFIGMNAAMVLVWGPTGVVDWNKYYYGFLKHIHVGEDDPVPLYEAWTWTQEFELAIGYVLAVEWLTVVAAATRIFAPKEIKLNNVLVPVLYSLLSILIVNASGYRHAAGLYNGFAVGAYVAMASLAKLDTVTKFATAGLLAALWGLTLTPFFVGFAGKSGFTSMLGHATYNAIQTYVIPSLKSSPASASMSASASSQASAGQSSDLLQRQNSGSTSLATTQSPPPPPPPPEPVQSPASPSQRKLKPKLHTDHMTKQQRRQYQRLQSLNSQQPAEQVELPQQEEIKLHHRAWSAQPQGESSWQHPMGSPDATTIDTERNTTV